MESTPRRAIVTLVHGTWGRGVFPGKRLKFWAPKRPIWSEQGSAFHTTLQRSLEEAGYEPRIIPIWWRGTNSIIERDHVAKALAGFLDNQAAQDPQACQIVIGHSHGGNIILSAARHYRRTTTPIHLITMATPFLDMLPIDEENPISGWTMIAQRVKGLKVFLVSVLVTYLVCAALARLWSFFDIRTLTMDNPLRLGVMLGLLMVIRILFTTLAWKYEDALRGVAMFNSPSAPGASTIRLLVLRGTDDEAALVLAAGALHTLLASRLVRLFDCLTSVILTFFTFHPI